MSIFGSKTIFCPYCKEKIKADANKCKHCGEWIVQVSDNLSNTEESKEFSNGIVSSNENNTIDINYSDYTKPLGDINSKNIKLSKFVGYSEISFGILLIFPLVISFINGLFSETKGDGKHLVDLNTVLATKLGMIIGVIISSLFIISYIKCGYSEIGKYKFQRKYLIGATLISFFLVITFISTFISLIVFSTKTSDFLYMLLPALPILILTPILFIRSIYLLSNFKHLNADIKDSTMTK
ncbi:MAG: zinc ribbon domain-containing protein [Ignavibacteria bacterium]